MSLIKVFTGPMRCGKSEMLLEQYNRYKIAKKNIIMFKPEIDTRTPNIVKSRNSKSVYAIEVKTIKDICELTQNIGKRYNGKIDAIFIDEFQFFVDSVKPLLQLSDEGIDIFISGLNLTTDRKPFNSIKEALCIASSIVNLTSICENCYNEEAIYTYCLQDKTEDVLIGDEQYIPVCCDCYKKLKSRKL